MPKDTVADWDSNPDNNTDIGGIPLGESVMQVAQINNAFREMMSQVKEGVAVLPEDNTFSGNSTFSGTATFSGASTFSSTISSTGINTFTKIQKWAKGADVASATELVLGDDGNYFDVTGTTPVTSIATKGVGTQIKLHYDGAVPLVNSADLVLLGGADFTTSAGDEAEWIEYASGDWRMTAYHRATGKPLKTETTYGSTVFATGTAVEFTSIEADVKELTLVFNGTSLSGSAHYRIQLGDSGGYETSGYTGANGGVVSSVFADPNSSGFDLFSGNSTRTFSGSVDLYLADAASNTWVCNGQISTGIGTSFVGVTNGNKALSAALDRIRVTTSNGTDTFTAGSFKLIKRN